MQNMKYKIYNKREMLNIIENKGFIFIDTNLGDHFVIKLSDLPDFIILESKRTCHNACMSAYLPGVDEAVITTYGCFLNKANPILREEIIDRLVKLQKNKIKPKKVKIFNNDVFIQLTLEGIGIVNNKPINFDKFYKKYIENN